MNTKKTGHISFVRSFVLYETLEQCMNPPPHPQNVLILTTNIKSKLSNSMDCFLTSETIESKRRKLSFLLK